MSETPMTDLLIKLDQARSAAEMFWEVNRNQYPAKGKWGWDDDTRFNKIANALQREHDLLIELINEAAWNLND